MQIPRARIKPAMQIPRAHIQLAMPNPSEHVNANLRDSGNGRFSACSAEYYHREMAMTWKTLLEFASPAMLLRFLMRILPFTLCDYSFYDRSEYSRPVLWQRSLMSSDHASRVSDGHELQAGNSGIEARCSVLSISPDGAVMLRFQQFEGAWCAWSPGVGPSSAPSANTAFLGVREGDLISMFMETRFGKFWPVVAVTGHYGETRPSHWDCDHAYKAAVKCIDVILWVRKYESVFSYENVDDIEPTGANTQEEFIANLQVGGFWVTLHQMCKVGLGAHHRFFFQSIVLPLRWQIAITGKAVADADSINSVPYAVMALRTGIAKLFHTLDWRCELNAHCPVFDTKPSSQQLEFLQWPWNALLGKCGYHFCATLAQRLLLHGDKTPLRAGLFLLCATLWSDSRVLKFGGVPGAGKTEFLSILVILLVVLFDKRFLWTAEQNQPLQDGVRMIEELLVDAPEETKQHFARLPGQSEPCVSKLDIAYESRGNLGKVSCALVTAGSLTTDYRNCYGRLKRLPKQRFLLVDEAQSWPSPNSPALLHYMERVSGHGAHSDIAVALLLCGDWRQFGAAGRFLPGAETLVRRQQNLPVGIRTPVSAVNTSDFLEFWSLRFEPHVKYQDFLERLRVGERLPLRAHSAADRVGLGHAFTIHLCLHLSVS